MSAESQRNYLEAIATAPSADELALEFDDVRHRLTTLGAEAAALAARIDTVLDAMSGPGPLWHVDALAVAPEWAELRDLAAELLRVLPFDGRPRPLAPSERALLEHVLADVPALRAQPARTRVLRPWFEGAAGVDLEVGECPQAEVADGVLPVHAEVRDLGEIQLRVRDGRLAALEFAWFSGEQPTTLPSVAQLSVRTR
jgi:hypothetical protein